MFEKPALGRVPAIDFLLLAALVSMISCTGAALMAAWRWPLVGDASLMRYVVFLLGSGHAPYSQIIDINLPGSYLLEAAAMRAFGGGAIGLRLYDGALSALICGCAVTLSKRRFRARACGLIGGLLIVLIHLRDGLVQAGQRDYAILALALLGYVLLLRGLFARRSVGELLFGFLAGCAVTIKPTMMLLILLPLYALLLRHVQPRDIAKRFSSVLLAYLVPFAAMFFWLHRWRAIPAFFGSMKLARRSHSLVEHKTFGFLMVHSVQPIAVLLVIGLMLLASRRFRVDVEQKLLLFGAAAGLGSFLLQGKGFPYQRYPFLGLILVVIFSLIADEIEGHRFNRALVAVALALCCIWWAPRFALAVASYDRIQPFEDSLGHELTALHAGPGDVQCLDTVGGCVNVLYGQRLVQSTGYLYDCYAYVGPADLRAGYRRSFLTAVEAARPRYIVLTSQSCLGAQGRIERIEEWPAMRDYLSQNYAETVSWHPAQSLHWWHQPETPPSFEIFSRK